MIWRQRIIRYKVIKRGWKTKGLTLPPALCTSSIFLTA